MVIDKTVINFHSLSNLWSTKLSCLISKRFVLLWQIYIRVQYMIFTVLIYSFSFLAQPWINKQSSKEISMGDIQGSAWHYPFVIERLSHFGPQSVQAILSASSQKLEFICERTIHQATEERVVISFSWYKDAIQAFRLLNRTSSLYINGVPYRFNMDTSKEYLPRVVADHYDYRLLVALKSLPCVCVHL